MQAQHSVRDREIAALIEHIEVMSKLRYLFAVVLTYNFLFENSSNDEQNNV